jgi:hypothetical protein
MQQQIERICREEDAMYSGSRWQPLRRLALAFVVLLGSASTAFAQFDRGTISGTVKDPGGLVVPGVTVTVTSQQTQQARTTVTDGSGFYTLPNLLPGQYEVAAELQGFKRVSRANVQLDGGASLVLDFTLTTGAITEEVTVTADAPLLQTEVAVRKTARRHRRQLQQRRLLLAHQWRLQHQRRPL